MLMIINNFIFGCYIPERLIISVFFLQLHINIFIENIMTVIICLTAMVNIEILKCATKKQ